MTSFPTATAAWVGISYLIGSVPSGLLISRLKGIDIRKVGSGNIGATNVFRSVGRPWGIATFVADALKGLIPAAVFPRVAHELAAQGPDSLFAVACAVAAILGHNFSVFLGFRGGKGVATSAGAVFGIAPAAAGIGAIIWPAVYFLTRYVSVASIAIAVAVPILSWWLYAGRGPLLPSTLTVLGILVILRHRPNISRLLNGTESRFARKPKVESGR